MHANLVAAFLPVCAAGSGAACTWRGVGTNCTAPASAATSHTAGTHSPRLTPLRSRRGGRGPRNGGGRGREYDRRSGTGRGHEVRRGGSGAGGWGNSAADAAAASKAGKAEDALAVAEAAEGADVAKDLEAEGAATPYEPEPEDSYVSLDAFLKQTAQEKEASALAGELEAAKAEAEAVDGKAHKKAEASGDDYLAQMKGSGIAAKASKKKTRAPAQVDPKLLRFKSGGDDYRPPRREGGDRKPREGGDRKPRRDGGDRKPRRDGDRKPRREGGDRKPRRAAAPKAADFPTLGSK